MSPLFASANAAPAAASEDPWIDTWDRAAVIAAYTAEFDRVEPSSGYDGSTSSCSPGTTTAAFRDSVVQRVNWYRRMAGLDTISENTTFSAHNQQAATMMAAEGSLSHGPGAGWECYTADGATAAGKSPEEVGEGAAKKPSGDAAPAKKGVLH